jgi:hypothetical protein
MGNIFEWMTVAVVVGSLAIGALGARARPQRRPGKGALAGILLLFAGFPAAAWVLEQVVAPEWYVERAGYCVLVGTVFPPHLMISLIALGIGSAGLLRRHAIGHWALVALAIVTAWATPLAAYVNICQHGGDDYPPGVFTVPYTVISVAALILAYVAGSLLDLKRGTVVG